MIAQTVERLDLEHTTVAITAHSLPVSVIRAGDTYEQEFRAAADAVVQRLGSDARLSGRALHTVVAFQSQGMSAGPGGRPMEWLGPDLRSAIEASRARGDRDMVFAPVGFLADHVEILYDLDIEARGWIEAAGITYHRTPSLNDGDAIVNAIVRVARPLLNVSHG